MKYSYQQEKQYFDQLDSKFLKRYVFFRAKRLLKAVRTAFYDPESVAVAIFNLRNVKVYRKDMSSKLAYALNSDSLYFNYNFLNDLKNLQEPIGFSTLVLQLFDHAPKLIISENINRLLNNPKQLVVDRIIFNFNYIQNASNPREANILIHQLEKISPQLVTQENLDAIMTSPEKGKVLDVLSVFKKSIPVNFMLRIINPETIRAFSSVKQQKTAQHMVDLITILARKAPSSFTLENVNLILKSKFKYRMLIRILALSVGVVPSARFLNRIIKNKSHIKLLLEDSPLSLATSTEVLSVELLALDLALTSKLEAVRYKRYLKVIQSDQNVYSARTDRLVQAKLAYKQLKKLYSPIFQKEPYNGNIDYIEVLIRKTILQAIKSNQSSDSRILEFIHTNFEELAQAQNETINKQARELFTSINDSAQIAWRCYDKDSPIDTSQGFDNLLVEQTEDKDVYNGDDVPLIDIKSASSKARKLAALYYLCATDNTTPDLQANAAERIEMFISALVDIRRSHNKDEDSYSLESPSCLPGMYKYFHNIQMLHPDLQPKLEFEVAVKDKIKFIVQSVFSEILEDKVLSNEDKLRLANSLFLLGEDNCKQIISGQEDLAGLKYLEPEMSVEQAVMFRTQFLASIDLSQVANSVTGYLQSQNILYDEVKMHHFITKYLMDLKGLNIYLSVEQRSSLMPVLSDDDFCVSEPDDWQVESPFSIETMVATPIRASVGVRTIVCQSGEIITDISEMRAVKSLGIS